ncbi:adenylate kinase [Candidatus Pacearchaeota archaeon]|nr:adenylate kinase [Candidatus Pacearchaeota archaeon]|tara:strand:- start:618 stop:1220 length:603 start_codon:yes stop_codon:yes gene_type:complete
MEMNLIFIGPQGSGKGTQAKIISEKLNLNHISTGDLIRNAPAEFASELQSYINIGNLVPDDVIIKLLKVELSKNPEGFILDGFPRNLNQARELDVITEIEKVVEISISDEEAIRRISSRLNCKNCGEIFNEITRPPENRGKCDNCSQVLFQRDDDNPQAIKKRLQVYHADTEPILEHYDSIKIDGEQSIDKVTQDILEGL